MTEVLKIRGRIASTAKLQEGPTGGARRGVDEPRSDDSKREKKLKAWGEERENSEGGPYSWRGTSGRYCLLKRAGGEASPKGHRGTVLYLGYKISWMGTPEFEGKRR